MNPSQLDRIRSMERALTDTSAALAAMDAALTQYESILPQLSALEAYYESPLWLQNYDDDHAGKLPTDLPRGVLSEDALYDLFCDNSRLRERLRHLNEKN